MMKITLQLVLCCVLLCSCKETSNDLKQESDKSEAINELTKDTVADEKEVATGSDQDIKIEFADLTLSIKDIDVSWWGNGRTSMDNLSETKNNTYRTKTDTAFFDLNPGDDWMFEKSVSIEQSGFDIVEVYAQTEIRVELSTDRIIEVPVCILGNWKGYTSKWTKLKIDKKNVRFEMFEEETDYPISFTLDEFKLAVEEHCGPEWLNDIKDIDALDKLPIDFFTTQYVYKIKIRNSKTKQVIEKFIVFDTPTSC